MHAWQGFCNETAEKECCSEIACVTNTSCSVRSQTQDKKLTKNIGNDCLTEEERLQNAEFERIVRELDAECEE